MDTIEFSPFDRYDNPLRRYFKGYKSLDDAIANLERSYGVDIASNNLLGITVTFKESKNLTHFLLTHDCY